MSLQGLTLQSLGNTKLAEQFAEAVLELHKSFETDADVSGERSITIKLGMKRDSGAIIVDMGCTYATPSRKVKTIAVLEHGTIKVDTISNDARQPDIFDNVKPITGAKSQGGA